MYSLQFTLHVDFFYMYLNRSSHQLELAISMFRAEYLADTLPNSSTKISPACLCLCCSARTILICILLFCIKTLFISTNSILVMKVFRCLWSACALSTGKETDMPLTLHMSAWFFSMRGMSVSYQVFCRSSGVLLYPWIKSSVAQEKLMDRFFFLCSTAHLAGDFKHENRTPTDIQPFCRLGTNSHVSLAKS